MFRIVLTARSAFLKRGDSLRQESPSVADVRGQYDRRLSQRRAQIELLDRYDWRLSVARGVTLLAGLGFAWAVFDPDRLHVGWLALPLAIFLLLVVLHERNVRSRARADRGAAYYERGLARIDDQWQGVGYDGDRFRDDAHPYANDLDLFGTGSLYQLLCTARTGIGRQTLAKWLLAPAESDEIVARQAAASELAGAIDLREELAVFGEEIVQQVHPQELADWAGAREELSQPSYRWMAPVLVVFLLAAAIGLISGVTGRALLGVAFLAHAGFALALRRRVDRVIAKVSRTAHELRLLGGVLARIENRDFASAKLRELRTGLCRGNVVPSEAIARLHRLIDLLDSRRNLLFAPVALVLMWGTQASLAIERWRHRYGVLIPRWLEAVGEFEALGSIGAYAFEHPQDPYPRIDDRRPVFSARAVGHPLLARKDCVCNDLELGPETHLLVVSGSNMSGKSTLMRTVGINCVLALAGAPVRARSLRVSPLWIGGTLRVQDSLLRGTSGFYAEIERFHQLVELAQDQPVLFLLEEILNTTNSHDRRIGARAVIGSLLASGAVGLVTTHDLAISEIVDELPGARNVHFVDHLEDGQIRFDYCLRQGVVSKSNALDLMRSIGLDV